MKWLKLLENEIRAADSALDIVKRRRAAYSDYVVTSGFNNTSSHGGPIRAGLRVRVTYVGNSILKLEIAKP